MSLIRCKECGVGVSSKATNCQNCGAPLARFPRWVKLAAMLVALIIFVKFLTVIAPGSSQTHPTANNQEAHLDKSPHMQARRLALIDKLIAGGIFHKVEKPAGLPHVWTTPVFNALSFENKQTFISVVYAYHITKDQRANIVILRDSRTGKQIGKYAAIYGGLSMD